MTCILLLFGWIQIGWRGTGRVRNWQWHRTIIPIHWYLLARYDWALQAYIYHLPQTPSSFRPKIIKSLQSPSSFRSEVIALRPHPAWDWCSNTGIPVFWHHLARFRSHLHRERCDHAETGDASSDFLQRGRHEVRRRVGSPDKTRDRSVRRGIRHTAGRDINSFISTFRFRADLV